MPISLPVQGRLRGQQELPQDGASRERAFQCNKCTGLDPCILCRGMALQYDACRVNEVIGAELMERGCSNQAREAISHFAPPAITAAPAEVRNQRGSSYGRSAVLVGLESVVMTRSNDCIAPIALPSPLLASYAT